MIVVCPMTSTPPAPVANHQAGRRSASDQSASVLLVTVLRQTVSGQQLRGVLVLNQVACRMLSTPPAPETGCGRHDLT